MSIVEGIDQVALLVLDVDRSVEWYQRVLGLERRHQEAWGSYDPDGHEIEITTYDLDTP